LLDDDEIEVGTLRASAFDDDTETLENAADLGSMIRDMSIDDITRPEPVEVDEDDEFEDDEDDFEEDELASNGDEDFEEDEVSGSEISEAQEEEFAEVASLDEASSGERVVADSETRPREGGREGGRRGRRDGRRGGRDRGGERSSGERAPDRSAERSPDRSSSSNGSRDRRGMAGSRHGGGRDRGGRSMQSTNLPAISDLLKPGQELLVQIAKEPIAKKGARITSHIALPGRFLVFMPTVGHTGVSRKIESDAERRRLKEILLSERGEATGGFIVRTAAAGASEEELRSDLRFLLNLWADIKARSDSSKSPALIYHDLNLIERILRDQVTDNFSAIWVDTENEYERVLRFLQRFQPSLIRRVKLYTKDTPLFEQFGITEEINKALRAKVWLKSGGSIVINQTEALVAIDINTGKYVGKTARLEDTILKTNLDAIPEIVRQIRLRDLGGIIIIDFIDMDERKNRNKVMAALEDELKKDRAPSKVLQFNDFGLVAITRKRVKQSLERTLSTTCGVCAGTGMVKSPVTVCNDIYIEMRKMHKLIEKGDIMLRVHPEVVKQLKTGSGKWLQEMEEMSGKTILVKSDPSLHPEQFDIH
jgi:ribonuclease G